MDGFDNLRGASANRRAPGAFRHHVLLFAVFGLFCVLALKLAHVQLVQGERLRGTELDRATRTVVLPPVRGRIFDAAGHPIATSSPSQSLYFALPADMTKAEAADLANRLADVFAARGDADAPLSAEDVMYEMDLDSERSYAYMPRKLKGNLTEEEVAYFMAHAGDFPHIEVVEESVRHYDPSSVAVQLVGYVKTYEAAVESLDLYKERQAAEARDLGGELVGFDGIELLHQEALRGTPGKKEYPIDAAGFIAGEPNIVYPQAGADVYLTIHKRIQSAAETALAEHLTYLRGAPAGSADRAPYAYAGYAVAMEVETGNVVAMASMPDYDPNVWSDGRVRQDEWRAISSIVYNGTIREAYRDWGSPEEAGRHASSLVFLGSTQKPLTVLIGLAEGLITPDTIYADRGVFEFGRKGTHRAGVRNDGDRTLGLLDPSEALRKSSNTFMAELVGNALYLRDGMRGVEIWDRYNKSFGLGASTESGLYGEQNGVAGYWDEAEKASAQSALVYASFGQQGKYTTLQLAQYTATLANRGKRLKPQFVSRIVDARGETVRTFAPEALNEIRLPDRFWEEIEAGMQSNVSGFEGVGYSFNRKTGTSEQDVRGGRVENAVFIGYAPADDPVLAVAVVVPEGGYGGRGAAPVARRIFDAYEAVYGW